MTEFRTGDRVRVIGDLFAGFEVSPFVGATGTISQIIRSNRIGETDDHQVMFDSDIEWEYGTVDRAWFFDVEIERIEDE